MAKKAVQYGLKITRFWDRDEIKTFEVQGDQEYVEKMRKKYKQ